jgi:hypothetical protein
MTSVEIDCCSAESIKRTSDRAGPAGILFANRTQCVLLAMTVIDGYRNIFFFYEARSQGWL